jgi:hypothetical protein
MSPAASTCSGSTGSGSSEAGTATCTSVGTMACSSGFSWAEASAPQNVDVSEDPAAELAALVARECGFLRLVAQEVYDESNRVRQQRGVVKCVVFQCHGLPWAKRSKWLQPLLWSVAAVLKLRGCTSRVQAGELYAQCCPGGDLIRLDFTAARV